MIRQDTKSAEFAPTSDLPSAPPEADRSDLGERAIRREIAADRIRERWLWLKATVALALVATLVVIRQVFFA